MSEKPHEDPGTQPYRVEYVSVPRDLLDEVLGGFRDYRAQVLVYNDQSTAREVGYLDALIRRLEECT